MSGFGFKVEVLGGLGFRRPEPNHQRNGASYTWKTRNLAGLSSYRGSVMLYL